MDYNFVNIFLKISQFSYRWKRVSPLKKNLKYTTFVLDLAKITSVLTSLDNTFTAEKKYIEGYYSAWTSLAENTSIPTSLEKSFTAEKKLRIVICFGPSSKNNIRSHLT